MFIAFPAIKQFEDMSLRMAEELGYVTTVCSRKRRLPEMQMDEFEFHWLKGMSPDDDPLDFDGNATESEVDEDLQYKWLQKLKKCRFGEKEKIINYAKQDGIRIVDNGGKIAEATRQTVNSRIQGCLNGDVRVQSKEFGIIRLRDFVNQTLTLWDGAEWTPGTIISSGKKQKCVITFSNGQRIICSPNHKFLTINTRGNKHFKELSELKIGDRIVVNPNFVDSDYRYNSDWAHIELKAHNALPHYLDEIKNRFDIGLFLGRLASDGSYALHSNGCSYIRHIFAEHEFDIIPIIDKICEPFNHKTDTEEHPRKNRSQRMGYININNRSLTNEISLLDIKHKVHDNIFMDTELLRGFVSGFFDGDGGISGDHAIRLTFGTQYDFTEMLNDLQKALLFFGIVSYQKFYGDRYVLTIRVSDASKFCKLVGFINKDKQTKAKKIKPIRDNHTFNQSVVLVKNIDITDDYEDMFDVCNTNNGYFIADGLVTHNSAADLTKLAMIKLWRNERLKELGFRVLIQVHDELICECPEENMQECSDLLASIMSQAAEEILEMPIKCDVEKSYCWYGEPIDGSEIKEKETNTSHGMDEDKIAEMLNGIE